MDEVKEHTPKKENEKQLRQRFRDLKKFLTQQLAEGFNPDDQIRTLHFSPHRSKREKLFIFEKGKKPKDGESIAKKIRIYHPNLKDSYIELSYDGKSSCRITRCIEGIGEALQNFEYSDTWTQEEYHYKSFFAILPYYGGNMPNSHERKKLRAGTDGYSISLTSQGLQQMMLLKLPPVYRLALQFFQEASFLHFAKDELEAGGFHVEPKKVEVMHRLKEATSFHERFCFIVSHARIPSIEQFYLGYESGRIQYRGISKIENSCLAIAIYDLHSGGSSLDFFNVSEGAEGTMLLTAVPENLDDNYLEHAKRYPQLRNDFTSRVIKHADETRKFVKSSFALREKEQVFADFIDGLEVPAKKKSKPQLVEVYLEERGMTFYREGKIADLSLNDAGSLDLSIHLAGNMTPDQKDQLVSDLRPLHGVKPSLVKRTIKSAQSIGVSVLYSKGYFNP